LEVEGGKRGEFHICRKKRFKLQGGEDPKIWDQFPKRGGVHEKDGIWLKEKGVKREKTIHWRGGKCRIEKEKKIRSRPHRR